MIGTIATIALASCCFVRPPSTYAESWTVPNLPLAHGAPTDDAVLQADEEPVTRDAFVSPMDRTMSQADWLVTELEAYRNVEADWAGEGTNLPLPSHIDAAASIVRQLPAGLPLPRPMISRSGEVGLYWKSDMLVADLVIEGSDSFSIFSRDRLSGAETFVEEMLVGSSEAREALVRVLT